MVAALVEVYTGLGRSLTRPRVGILLASNRTMAGAINSWLEEKGSSAPAGEAEPNIEEF